MNYKKSPQ